MAPSRKSQRPAQSTVTFNRRDPNHVLVNPRWLMRVFGLTIVAAFVCAYLLMCALVRVGSWQWVLHPTQHAAELQTLPGEPVRFGPDSSGTPQLAGHWIAASTPGAATAIYLRPGDGQLDFADLPTMQMLHDDGLNVLAFDYRGYGASAPKPHPTQDHMQQDAAAAWAYVTGLRGSAPGRVVLYGAGVGAALATDLAIQHPDAGALILRNASADVLGTIRNEKRARFFPVSLLLHDRFLLHLNEAAPAKLLLDIGSAAAAPEAHARAEAYRSAHDPKRVTTLPQNNPVEEQKALRRFLDEQAGLSASAVSPTAGTMK